ncbi:uncharacterized protein N0V89_011156 [Didymosphaeria variabile]|uniref:Cleavage and polyadenylation specificity factor subunit 2 n=1 Tax=Didymosphaeria variabile TaxID=1932322 RepID=A0A9W8XDI1_9PLEO|nr:uncharacterized protein N0V89_011156 [Didymosphaeria variabile]KAJ4347217.1 hypothetical protein N0V89_011156 [Didymosphaeria variabile]
MFTFTPLLGAQSASSASQSLLEFDGGIKVLVDVGWDEGFDVEKLKEIEKHIPTLSFILLTHATIAHIGAFVHCCKHFPQFKSIPVYATTPVISLGRTLLQDLYESTPLACSTVPADALAEASYSLGNTNPNILMQAPTSEEIANYFGLINPLKYSQPTQPQQLPNAPPLGTLTITAYSAGHTLGGTIWHIQHGMESIVYAVDWNQARERALPGAAWFGEVGGEVIKELRRPTAMICSSRGTGLKKAVGLNQRDEALVSLIRDTVANGGSVLIPSDSSARILELAHLLEETWKEVGSQLNNAKVYLASRTAGATMRYARSMLEWMEKGIENDSFDFKHITLLERRSRVTRMLAQTEPRVILASDTSLEWGFSKDAIKSLASDPRNLIVLTERIGDPGGSDKGLGRYLWELWNEKNPAAEQDSGSTASIPSDGTQAPLRSARAVALNGQELPLYQQYLARQRQLQTTMQGDSGTALETSGAVGDDWSASTSTTSEDSDDEHQGRLLNTATILRHTRKKLGLSDEELGVKILVQRKNMHDWDVRAKRGEEKMFPIVTKQRRMDEFGEVIRPEEFARADEDDQVATEALRDGPKKDNEIGQKRKWEDLTIQTRDGGRQKKNRKPESDAQGLNDGRDASDDEPEDDQDRIEGPSKVIFEMETLQLHCRIAFVDFSALHDLRIINNLLPLIQPRKLIFVAGDEVETEKLAEEARTVLAARAGESSNIVDVFTPGLGDTIDASVDTNAWTVKLSRNMVRKLQWQKVRGLGVVAITGRLAAASLEPSPEEVEDTPAKKKAKLEAASSTAENDKMDATPILDVVPANFSTAVRTVAQPFHVGDLRLPDLRKFLQASGMTAEFGGAGVLVINGNVSVTINKLTNRVEVDGGAYNLANRKSDGVTFYKVKRKIYEGLAVVAGN